MQVQILREAGFEEAMLGLSLSHNAPPANMPLVAQRLHDKDGGHNKFLEAIVVWLDVTAPRHFWQQFDTVRVGMTKQSGSTMHTLTHRPLGQEDFEQSIPDQTLARLNALIVLKDLVSLKNELPEGFLQRRIICTNYKTLRNIIQQRRNHRSPCWPKFCKDICNGVRHPSLLPALYTLDDAE